MARLHHVLRARKARRKFGIKRGMEYWWWKFYRCGKCFSLTRPRPSRLTRSEFLGVVLSVQEKVEDAVTSALGSLAACEEDDENEEAEDELEGAKSTVVDSLNSALEAVTEQRDQCKERASNVEQAFPYGCPSLELLQERVERCDQLIDEIEAAVSEVEGAGTAEEVDSAVGSISWDVS